MNRARRPHSNILWLLSSPALWIFQRCAQPATICYYQGAARNFLSYLGVNHPR